MATLKVFQPIDMLNSYVQYGYVTIATSNHVQITSQTDSNETFNYYGYGLTYNSQNLTGGDIVRVTHSNPVTVSGRYIHNVYEVDDFTAPATLVESFINLGDVEGLQQYLLSGNDYVEGSPFNDRLIAWGGDDLMMGGAGSDALYGSNGNDTLRGGAGDDFLIGGDGLDFAIMGGPLSNFTSRVNPDGALELTDTAPNGNGTDYLAEIERIRFTDVVVALDTTGIAGEAYRLYKAAFDRTPDLTGLGFWIENLDSGVSLLEAANGFINSAEFQADYGVNPSDRDFVQLLYENVLDRQPDASGYEYWVSAMQNGLSRGQVLVEFSNSPENIQNVAPLVANGIRYAPYGLSGNMETANVRPMDEFDIIRSGTLSMDTSPSVFGAL
mgnify:CR=1 FL=1